MLLHAPQVAELEAALSLRVARQAKSDADILQAARLQLSECQAQVVAHAQQLAAMQAAEQEAESVRLLRPSAAAQTEQGAEMPPRGADADRHVAGPGSHHGGGEGGRRLRGVLAQHLSADEDMHSLVGSLESLGESTSREHV